MKITQTIRNLDKVLGTKPETTEVKPRVASKPPRKRPERPVIQQKHLDRLAFAEVVNARAAITGQMIGPLVFSETGMPLVEQIRHPECVLLVSVWCAYIALSSRLAWDFYNPNGIFEKVEMACGQISMLLFLMQII
jgi:hypothetical protein